MSPPQTAATEEYDGSTWTSIHWFKYSKTTSATEEYNGSSWANNPTGLTTARYGLAGAGTQTAALAFGGYDTATSAATEEYDGSTWTSVNSLNTARFGLGGAGTQTAALGFGGGGPTDATEEWTGAGAPLTQTITVS
jgi:hypothetical protein